MANILRCKSYLFEGGFEKEIRRFSLESDIQGNFTYTMLKQKVCAMNSHWVPEDSFTLYYIDEEGDKVAILNDEDLLNSFEFADKKDDKLFRLIIETAPSIETDPGQINSPSNPSLTIENIETSGGEQFPCLCHTNPYQGHTGMQMDAHQATHVPFVPFKCNFDPARDLASAFASFFQGLGKSSPNNVKEPKSENIKEVKAKEKTVSSSSLENLHTNKVETCSLPTGLGRDLMPRLLAGRTMIVRFRSVSFKKEYLFTGTDNTLFTCQLVKAVTLPGSSSEWIIQAIGNGEEGSVSIHLMPQNHPYRNLSSKSDGSKWVLEKVTLSDYTNRYKLFNRLVGGYLNAGVCNGSNQVRRPVFTLSDTSLDEDAIRQQEWDIIFVAYYDGK